MKRNLLENRLFYKRVLTLAVPIVIQNSITQMVSLLDNIMVGQLGTLPMSGVSIVNQLLHSFLDQMTRREFGILFVLR